MGEQRIAGLIAALGDVRYFEQAAAVTLRPMLRIASEALEARYDRKGRMLRATIHWRPDDSYRRFAVLEQEAAIAGADSADAQVGPVFFTSASIWRLVVAHRCSVSVDVNLGRLQPQFQNLPARSESSRSESFGSAESQQRFLGRQASHAYVVPLRAPGGMVDGMIVLEADCMAAVGQEALWDSCAEELKLIADVAAPYLAYLPLRPSNPSQVDEFLPVIGNLMLSLVPILRVFAQQDETVLISGPTGAGKSRLARWCHEQSSRRGARFESLDLVTIPEDLQMAELFGWRKGAFSGAVNDNPGFVARAEGGTLFIDEIDKLSLKAQAGLLHLLEERTYRRLGEGNGDREANVRFVVGTNANLREAVRSGAFREDLYYRINVLPIRVPSLDERKDEIPLWARYMVSRRHHSRVPGGAARLTPEAEQLLSTSAWPGNLRQLDNIIRRAYTLAMADSGNGQQTVLLEERHISGALSYEDISGRGGLVATLQRAAQAFVLEAQQAQSPWDLDLADAFKGFVLGTAVQTVGREEAFRLFSREGLVKNRNHHKTLRRELDKVDHLLRVLGVPNSPFVGLGEPEDE